MAEQKINFSITDGDSILADEITVLNQPLKFYIDFKSTTPRVDVRNPQGQTVALKHTVIVCDPWLVKELRRILGENIKLYEDNFGEIKKPKQLEIAEKKIKEFTAKTVTTSEKIKQPYLG